MLGNFAAKRAHIFGLTFLAALGLYGCVTASKPTGDSTGGAGGVPTLSELRPLARALPASRLLPPRGIAPPAPQPFLDPSSADLASFNSHAQFQANGDAHSDAGADWLYARGGMNAAAGYGSGAGSLRAPAPQGTPNGLQLFSAPAGNTPLVAGLIASGVDHTHPIFAGGTRSNLHAASVLTYALPSAGSKNDGDYTLSLQPLTDDAARERGVEDGALWPVLSLIQSGQVATTQLLPMAQVVFLEDGQTERDAITVYPTSTCTPQTTSEPCVRALRRADGTWRELPSTRFGFCQHQPAEDAPCLSPLYQGRVDYLEHGTALAGVLAGQKLSELEEAHLLNDHTHHPYATTTDATTIAAYPHGVAYEAQLLVATLRARQRKGDTEDVAPLAEFRDAVRLQNQYASAVAVGHYPNEAFSASGSLAALQDFESDAAGGVLAHLAQRGREPRERTIYVFGAGDCHDGADPISFRPLDPDIAFRPSESPSACFLWDETARDYVFDKLPLGSSAIGSPMQDATTAYVDPAHIRDPLLWATLPSRFAEIFGEDSQHILTAVGAAAISEDNGQKVVRLDDHAHRCGVAAAYCLIVPGGGGPYLAAPLRNYLDDDSEEKQLSAVYGNNSALAAAYLAGGLVALQSYFNGQLNNAELVERVLATATKNFTIHRNVVSEDGQGGYTRAPLTQAVDITANGAHAEAGQGILDLKAASEPIGTLALPNGGDIHASAHPLSASHASLGAPFGDALARALAHVNVMAVDALGAPFPVPLAAQISTKASASSFHNDYATLLAPRQRMRLAGASQFVLAPPTDTPADGAYFLSLPLGFSSNPKTATQVFGGHGVQPSLSLQPELSNAMLARGRESLLPTWTGLELGHHFGVQHKRVHLVGFAAEREPYANAERRGHFGTMLSWTATPAALSTRWRARAQIGYVREQHALAGSLSQGALQLSTLTDTWFVGTQQELQLGRGWHALGSAYLGITNANAAAHTLWQELGTIISSQFALALVRPKFLHANAQLSLYLAQPLRVEQGTATLRTPQARTSEQQILYANHNIPLAPSGRQLELGINYTATHQRIKGKLQAGASLISEPAHTRTAAPQAQLLLRYRLNF